mmetsp:Transcript_33366/g.91306  ORF Transcript_33366/g.91306 Transcript_33366/m.91306 type:complete len:201 (-) Transcript_33366:141-743(-)
MSLRCPVRRGPVRRGPVCRCRRAGQCRFDEPHDRGCDEARAPGRGAIVRRVVAREGTRYGGGGHLRCNRAIFRRVLRCRLVVDGPRALELLGFVVDGRRPSIGRRLDAVPPSGAFRADRRERAARERLQPVARQQGLEPLYGLVHDERDAHRRDGSVDLLVGHVHGVGLLRQQLGSIGRHPRVVAQRLQRRPARGHLLEQ